MLKIILTIWFCVLFLAVVDSKAATVPASSASHAHVSAAISSANEGDTVTVPSGNVTWNSNLVITKGIILQGAGSGSTIITSNFSGSGDRLDTGYSLISYEPSSPSNDAAFRITGFKIDGDNHCYCILIRNKTMSPLTKIRIDNNIIEGGAGRGIVINGTVYGVIDNNEIIAGADDDCSVDSYGNNASSWNGLTFEFGLAANMYYEDNTFTVRDSPHSCGAGGRYVSRFNTYSSSKSFYPWFDAHGNQAVGSNHATMGVEIYENTVTMSNNSGVRILDQRGGMGVLFNNNVITSGPVATQAREEYPDSNNPETNPQPQHVSDSYYWNNTKNGSTIVNATEAEDCCNAIAENSEFYNFNTSFNGTTGVGVGVIASRPSTCTAGVAYWATDEGGNWNTENGPGEDGTLYRCTSTNTWTDYFTPYTYPHPLRTGTTSTPVSSSSTTTIQTSSTTTVAGTTTTTSTPLVTTTTAPTYAPFYN